MAASVAAQKTSETKNKKKRRISQAIRTKLSAFKKYKTSYPINAQLFKHVPNDGCIECNICATRLWKRSGTAFPKLNDHVSVILKGDVSDHPVTRIAKYRLRLL